MIRGRMESRMYTSAHAHNRKATAVIATCWLVYVVSCLGKLGYTANIVEIEREFGVTHSESGLVGTLFFFAYGAGQIINGIFCRRYKLRLVLPSVLLISCGCNVALLFLHTFAPVKYIWLLNGAVCSALWPCIMRFLSEHLSEKDIPRATVAMSSVTAVGTFLVFCLSAWFVAVQHYRTIFAVAALATVAGAVAFFIVSGKVAAPSAQETTAQEPCAEAPKEAADRRSWLLYVSIGEIILFAIIANLVKDGLNTWVPGILKDIYTLPSYISILLTLALPTLAIFGTVLSEFMGKKIRNIHNRCTVLFVATAVCIGAVILLIQTGFVLPLMGLALVVCLTSAINIIITTAFPFSMKRYGNVSFWAGFTNGCCYIGSTLSTYCLGTLATGYGWGAVFWFLLGLCVFAAVVGFWQWTATILRASSCKKSL